jgi:predicted phosphodiesterase
MVKYAFISDIHSNQLALEAVLRDIERQGIKDIHCLGDIVGYGPKPNECVDIVRSRNIPCVIGNHDHMVGNMVVLWGVNPDAAASLDWTKKVLGNDLKAYLRGLEPAMTKEGYTLAHGSPFDPLDFNYMIDRSDVFWGVFSKISHQPPNIQSQTNLGVYFIGHTHFPSIFQFRKNQTVQDESGVEFIKVDDGVAIQLSPDFWYVINVGSVGKPRDNDPRSCYVTFDSTTRQVTYHKVDYDIQKTQEQMRQVRLPEALITKLEFGR